MRLRALAAITALSSALPGALAWGAAGHEIVAAIAQMHLHPPILPLLCTILYPERSDSDASSCTLASVAAWADRERMHMRWSAPMHYVGSRQDHPPEHCAFPGTGGWAGRTDINVLHAVRNVSGLLDDFVARGGVQTASGAQMAAAGEALRFLVHFLGDLHQPLHLTGRDRGGNGAKVAWNGRHTNLHSLWDGLLIAKALRSIPRNYTRPLPVPPMEAVLKGTIYDPYIRRIMWDGIGLGAYSDVPGRWAAEVEDWLECPPRAQRTVAQVVMGYVGLRIAGSETDDERICPKAWAAPIHTFNCDFIWPAEIDEAQFHAHEGGGEDAHHAHSQSAKDELADAMREYVRPGRNDGGLLELDTPEYAGRIADEWVVEKLLAQGGIRLAGVLNAIFAPLVEDSKDD